MSIWTKTSAGWVEIGGGGSDGLEGLGGWATITAVSGSPKRYAYPDPAAPEWVAFEWTDTSKTHTLTTLNGGLVDAVVCGGGGAGKDSDSTNGASGHVVSGIEKVETVASVTVGYGGRYGATINGSAASGVSTSSVLGEIIGGAACWGHASNGSMWDGVTVVGDGGADHNGFVSDITGKDVVYGPCATSTVTGPGKGGRKSSNNGTDGAVIVRVPAAQAAGVDPGSWVTRIDHYAEVTDGIVTDLYQERFYGDDTVRTENGRFASPEQPDDLIPCDPGVAEGWSYADGEFTPPPPDPSWREQAIEALQEQLKDLQKDT